MWWVWRVASSLARRRLFFFIIFFFYYYYFIDVTATTTISTAGETPARHLLDVAVLSSILLQVHESLEGGGNRSDPVDPKLSPRLLKNVFQHFCQKLNF